MSSEEKNSLETLKVEGKNSLETLKVSITKMSDADLHKLIAEVRDSRKRPKKIPKAITSIKKGKKQAGKQTVDLEKLMGSMTDEQRELLIVKLEGMQE